MAPTVLDDPAVAPPAPAEAAGDPQALIEEARRRQRRRRRRAFAAAIAGLSLAALAYLGATKATGRGSTTSDGRSAVTSRTCPGVDLGTVAFVRGGALTTVDFRHCRTRVLVPAHVSGPLQFSHDGRYIAFLGGYVPTAGGPVRHLDGSGVWSPRRDLLAVITRRGGVELVAPGRRARLLLPDGFGATTLLFSPDGRSLAVSRSRFGAPGARPPYHQEIWQLDLRSGRRRLLFRQPKNALGPPWLASYSPDGRWLLFWEDTQNSASLAADGLPLLVLPIAGGKPVEIASTLHYRDYLSWCGRSLVFVSNHGGRLVTDGDGIAVASPPAWRPETILPVASRVSWNAAACKPESGSTTGRLAIAAGPSRGNDMSVFGREQRSIWLVDPTPGATPTRLAATIPPRTLTDELPMWSADGSWILFVRTTPGGIGGRGRLYAIRLADQRLVGPIAPIGGTSNYYGSYAWVEKLDWHR